MSLQKEYDIQLYCEEKSRGSSVEIPVETRYDALTVSVGSVRKNALAS